MESFFFTLTISFPYLGGTIAWHYCRHYCFIDGVLFENFPIYVTFIQIVDTTTPSTMGMVANW